MSGKKYSEKHTIPYFLCDRKNELTVPMLVNFIIMISSNQSDDLNIDQEKFAENGYGWIVIQYEFDVLRMPKSEEQVEIETHAVAYNKLFCYRDFYVYDNTGKKIITVKSTFALMNKENRKIMRIPQEVIEPYQADYEKRIRRTPSPVELELSKSNTKKTYHVRYFDIDENNHVNNSQYFSWALDALSSDFLATHQITHGIIKFTKEVHEEEVVDSYADFDDTSEKITSLHKIKVGDKENSLAEFHWSSIY